jgi:hypothetical protein
MNKLTKEQSQKTITKKMIRNILGGKLTNYAYNKEIKDAISEAVFELDNDDNFQELCYYDRTSTEQFLYKNTRKIEENLRKEGLRIWGDK